MWPIRDRRRPSRAAKAATGPAASTSTTRARFRSRTSTRLPPEEVSATCTTCHNRGEHAFWDGSQHDSRKLTCTTCHSVHDYKSDTKQLKEKTQAAVCATCHRDKLAKLDRSGHMPVREGKLECTTCHNVHGTTNVRLLRKGDSIAELCTSCHAEKRGPFLWEHAPSRDGCVTCHDPHGSSNERMLVAKPPILCQRCHVATRHPSTIYDAALVGAGGEPEHPHLWPGRVSPVTRRSTGRIIPAVNGSFDERGEAQNAHLTQLSQSRALALVPVLASAQGTASQRDRRPGPERRVDRLRRARDDGQRRGGTLRALSRSSETVRSSASSG